MSTATPQRETFLPGRHPEQLAQILELLRPPVTDDRTTVPRYFLSGADPGGQVEIPAEVHRVLQQVVDAMRQGLAVTVEGTPIGRRGPEHGVFPDAEHPAPGQLGGGPHRATRRVARCRFSAAEAAR